MLNVEVRHHKPYKVNGVFVADILDSYRLWPHWWEGNPPRDYFKVQVDEKTLDIYVDTNGWTIARIED
jgi:hypothetical protein